MILESTYQSTFRKRARARTAPHVIDPARFPAEEFVVTAASWDLLETAYDQARAQRFTDADFKFWLTTNRGADFSGKNVEAAARKLPHGDALPQEFTNFSLTVQSLGLMGPVDPLESQVGH